MIMVASKAASAKAVFVRKPRESDASAIYKIDADGLATGHASFREAPYDWTTWCNTYTAGSAIARVAVRDDWIVGWAAVVPMSDRCTYCGVGEVSVYVAENMRGCGVGTILLRALVEASEAGGYWTLVAQCFPENEGSVRLHERGGFKRLGIRERLGRMSYGVMAEQWRDVLMLERRSDQVGQ